MGSPRVSGSINASHAGTSWGLCWTNFFRPAPEPPYSLHGEGWLMKVLNGTIDGRTRESRHTGDEDDRSAPNCSASTAAIKCCCHLFRWGNREAYLCSEFFCWARYWQQSMGGVFL